MCFVGVRLWSTVGLCKSVRYLVTRKGVRKGARTPLTRLPSHPRVSSFLLSLSWLTHPKPPLTKGWTGHWRSLSIRGWLFFRLPKKFVLTRASFRNTPACSRHISYEIMFGL